MHQFSAGGLYNGLILLIDDETRTYWDHITGVGVHGELTGYRLDVWRVDYTTVGAALKAHPTLSLSRPRRGLQARFMNVMHRKKIGTAGFLPPTFRETMSAVDTRLSEMTQGLGIFDDAQARFYPMGTLQSPREDPWGDRKLLVRIDPASGVPVAEFLDDGEQPLQLFSRWYGFVLTFPDCEIGG